MPFTEYNSVLTHIHIADIHFGCMNPQEELDILRAQFLNRINQIAFDILSIDGDLFDRRFTADNAAIQAAIEFVNECASLCFMRGAALIIINGTGSHDAGQLSIFKGMPLFGAEVYIVNQTQFIETHNVKILCIPEEYGKGAAYYDHFLKETYDMVFMHGTLINAVPKATEENLSSNREPVFSIDSFSGCLGPIYAGHVHVAQCVQGHMYYISSPIRWKFGEEQAKGYLIALYDRATHMYYNQFMEIQSYYYNTISISDLNTTDPNEIIQALETMHNNDIHYLRLNCKDIPQSTLAIIRKYYHEMKSPYLKLYSTSKEERRDLIDIDTANENSEILSSMGMEFLFEDKIDDLTKFVMYVNLNNGSDIISVEALKKMLSGS